MRTLGRKPCRASENRPRPTFDGLLGEFWAATERLETIFDFNQSRLGWNYCNSGDCHREWPHKLQQAGVL
jgi:hypothetical protein